MSHHNPKVLIAYDGSANADATIIDLKQAGLGKKVHARVISASDIPILPLESLAVATDVILAGAYAMNRPKTHDLLKEARELAKKGAQKLRKEFPSWTISSAGVIDSPAHGILKAAEKWKPSLIALGSKGRGTMERLLLGSVSHRVLTHGTCNVRVTRQHLHSSVVVPRVLVAVDGSKDAEVMVERVAARFWEKTAEFRVIVVVDYRLSMIHDFRPKNRGSGFTDFPERIAEAAMRRLSDAGLKVTSAVREGDSRREILLEAKRFKANSLFLGSRGLGGLGRFFLGSVSSYLAEHAPCTVEVDRR